MSKVINLKHFKKGQESRRPTDPWCAKLVRDDGTVLAGGAAREVRLSKVGGVEKLLEMANALARRTG